MKTMIKVWLPFVILLLGLQVQAQVSIGPKIGVNLANVYLDPEEVETDSRTALQYGLVLNLPVSDVFSVQPELGYISRGFIINESISDPDFGTFNVEAETAFNYLDLSVLGKFWFRQETGPGFYFLVGPYLGYGLNGEVTARVDIEGLAEESTEKLDWDEDGLNRIDFGAVAGAGFSFGLDNLTLFLDARYMYGFGNLNEDADDTKFQHRGLGFLVGALIPL